MTIKTLYFFKSRNSFGNRNACEESAATHSVTVMTLPYLRTKDSLVLEAGLLSIVNYLRKGKCLVLLLHYLLYSISGCIIKILIPYQYLC